MQFFNMQSVKKKIILVIFFFIIFGGGFWIGKTSVVCEVCPPQDVDFSLFWQTLEKLEEKYVKPGTLNTQEMIYGAISGMVKSLEDPYTVFFSPDETKKFLEDVSGRFEGVGMEIGIRKEKLQVIAPLEGTPAQEAGLRAGDIIVKVEDTRTIDITIEEAVSLIRGPKGTEVTLSVLRNDWDSSKEFKIKRAVIEIPSLKWEIKEENIAYINLYHFSEKADSDFSKAALQILNSPAEKIILDLRNNPGGYLEISQDIAGWFLEKGNVVVVEDFRNSEEDILYKAEGNAKLSSYPIIVLINQGSASAAEILAAALRDNRGVKLVGETSFGKGCVQELVSLRDNSSLKVTVANWLTPERKQISEEGLEPDIRVEITEEDYAQDRDPQLEKAIEIIRGME